MVYHIRMPSWPQKHNNFMNKRNKIIYWIATVWLSLGMTVTGVVQLLHVKAGAGGADSLQHLGYPLYVLTLLGICKILGVITILLPRLPLLKEWAYAGFVFLMCGALFSHLASGDAFSEMYGALLLLVLSALSWYFRPVERKVK